MLTLASRSLVRNGRFLLSSPDLILRSCSNNIQRFAEVPSVRINYDIVPIIVHVKSKFTSFYTFLTRLCAILGGVFTITGIVTAIVDAGVTTMLKKDRLGKLG